MSEALVLEPRERFDSAIIGTVERCGMPMVVCYDRHRLVDILCEDDMSYEEAQEFIDFNITGCYAGEGTWMVLNPAEAAEVYEYLSD